MTQLSNGTAHVKARVAIGINIDGIEEKPDEIEFTFSGYAAACNVEIINYCFRLKSLFLGFSGTLQGSAIWDKPSFPSRLWRLGLHLSLLCAYANAPSAVPDRLKTEVNNFSLEMSNVGLGVMMYPGALKDEELPFEVAPLLEQFHTIAPFSKLNGWWYCK